MKFLKTLSIVLFMLTSAMILSSCAAVDVHEHGNKHGHKHKHKKPPSHGHKHKHKNHELEYHSDLGVYVVIGLPNYYFIDGIYYKHTEHGWYSSHDVDKDWKKYTKDVLPGNLHKKHDHKKGHGKHKDKHGKKHKHDD
jgi:hypothetical protein